MVVLNTANSERTIETSRFEECLKGSKSARDVITGQKTGDISKLTIPANSPLVYEILR